MHRHSRMHLIGSKEDTYVRRRTLNFHTSGYENQELVKNANDGREVSVFRHGRSEKEKQEEVS